MKPIIKKCFIVLTAMITLVGCTSTNTSKTTIKESSTNAQSEEINLTIDNWQDYLEMKEEYNYKYNDSNEIISSKVFIFYLKNGKTFKGNSNSKINITFDFDYNLYSFKDADFTKGTFEYDELLESKDSSPEETTLSIIKDKDMNNALGYIYEDTIYYNDGNITSSNVIYDVDGTKTYKVIKLDKLTITAISGTININ